MSISIASSIELLKDVVRDFDASYGSGCTAVRLNHSCSQGSGGMPVWRVGVHLIYQNAKLI